MSVGGIKFNIPICYNEQVQKSVLAQWLQLICECHFRPENIDMSELCITSSAQVKENETTEIVVETIKAKGKKCPVCWKIRVDKCQRHSTCHLK